MADTSSSLFMDLFIRDKSNGATKKAGKDVDVLKDKLDGFKKLAAGSIIGGGIFSFFKDAVAEAEDAAKVGAQTEAVIKSMGASSWTTAGKVESLATALSKKTAVDDEAIQSGANMLLTFGQIQNRVGEGNDIFDQAVTVTNDLSVAMGKDMTSSATMVGKALNDPIKGVSALTKVGIQFTASQKQQIAAMVAAGDVMGAQKIILGELNNQFAGSAEAQATGADKLRVAWGNFKEGVGTEILPVLGQMADVIDDNGPAAENLAVSLGNLAANGIGALVPLLQVGTPLLSGLASVINGMPPGVVALVTGLLGMSKIRSSEWFQNAADTAKSFGSQIKTAAAESTGFMGKIKGVGSSMISTFGPGAAVAGVGLLAMSLINAQQKAAALEQQMESVGSQMVETGFDAKLFNESVREGNENKDWILDFADDLGLLDAKSIATSKTIRDMADGIIKTGKDSEFTKDQMASLTAKQKELNAALAGGDISKAKSIYKEMADDAAGYATKASDAAAATAELAEETDGLSDGWIGAKTQLAGYQDALDALRGVQKGVLQSEIDLHEAQAKSSEVFADGDATYDDRVQSLLDLSKANDDYIASLEASGASDAEVAQARADQTAGMEDMLAQLQSAYGLTDEQVQKLRESLVSLPATTSIAVDFDPEEPQQGISDILTQLQGLPPNTPVTVNTNDPEVIAALQAIGLTVVQLPDGKGIAVSATEDVTLIAERVRRQIASIPDSKTVNISASVSGSVRSISALLGGGHARGGRVKKGEVSWVGEEGPELVQFDGDGEVIPHRESMAMFNGAPGGGGGGGGGMGMPAAGGGPTAVRVVLDVTGADQDMVRMIRKWIRTEGLLVGTSAA